MFPMFGNPALWTKFSWMAPRAGLVLLVVAALIAACAVGTYARVNGIHPFSDGVERERLLGKAFD
mgnify:CR=1 FL=1